MAASSGSLREADLRPYQTHIMFRSQAQFTPREVGRLLQDLPSIVDQGIRDEALKCKVIQQSPPRKLSGEIVAWLVYRRELPVTWAKGPATPRDVEHHLAVIMVRGRLITLVATDKSLGTRLLRGGTSGTAWSNLDRISHDKLESALVHGTARTLWLSGIHRSVATKPDSKVLIGSDVEASLDALGDQTYQYTSTRCEGPAGVFVGSSVGITPRLGKVWLGPSSDWELLVTNTQKLLEVVDSSHRMKETPYPILARAKDSLRDVRDAFDIGFTAPEYLYEDDPQLVERLEGLLQRATWSVKPEKGPACIVILQLADRTYQLRIELGAVKDAIIHTVTPLGEAISGDLEAVVELLRRADVLRIFYDSLHTYSNGQVFEVRTRPVAFPLRACDFAGFDITLEKPERRGLPGESDLQRIGESGDRSLFTWVWKRYQRGWLWCDDGSGEIADFIHLDSKRSILSLIHVKAANSALPTRGISVSAYEVVCAQALKNLRYTERADLERPLKEKLKSEGRIVRGWRDGKELPLRSDRLWTAIAAVRYSNLIRRVVVLQPHVRTSALPANLDADTREVRRARLLHTLLYGVKADLDRYGVEFDVLAAT